MAARVQGLVFATSKGKQADIATPASTFLRWRKTNMNLTSPEFMTENDAAEIGKGNEFITEVFNVACDAKNTIEKFGSAEFMTWAWAFGLGGAAVSGSGPYTYTITPIDPGTTLELPYFTLAEQLAEGGGNAFSNLFPGCAVEEVALSFNYGPGRQSVKMSVGFIGSGVVNSATGATIPAVLSENYYVSQSMQLNINGTDYVAAKTILSGTIGWKNNLNTASGYYPGSGLQAGFAVRGRIEIGERVPSFTFQIRMLHTSTEYAQLKAQTTGTATVSFTNGAYSTTFNWTQVSFSAVELGNADGLVTLQVTVAPQFNATILSITSVVAVGGICQ